MAKLESPPGYGVLNEGALRARLAADEVLASRLGGACNDWKITEVGDGNLNQVFIAKGPAGDLVIKQALPYLRLVGESWPLPLSRAHFENLALQSQMRLTPGSVPQVLGYDAKMYCITMELLSPHIIMRKGMIAGIEYPCFAATITDFMARNLFFTSDLACPASDKRQAVAEFCGNHVLCKITEDVIFTEPYMQHDNNRWTTPALDGYARRWCEDSDLHAAVNMLKLKFMNEAQALLHGDLHTGSIMVTAEDTQVIDPEFAFYGPMGFDVGKLIANFMISYFSQSGHEETPGGRDGYRRWIKDVTVSLWDDFSAKFLALWRDVDNAAGDAYPTRQFTDSDRLERERERYMQRLFADAIGFCGACLTRRILGIAHNIDLEGIEQADVRGVCEARVLELSHELLTRPADFKSIGDIVATAERLQGTTPQLTG